MKIKIQLILGCNESKDYMEIYSIECIYKKISNLSFHLRNLEKEEQIKSEVTRRK